MPKVLILGGNGMLGSEMFDYFSKKNNFKIFSTTRNKEQTENNIFFDAVEKNNFEFLNDFDFVINCIGTTKPFIELNQFYLEKFLISVKKIMLNLFI